jgi:hypothetical protein
MGQKYWAIVCALGFALTAGAEAVAAPEVTNPTAQESEPGRPDPGVPVSPGHHAARQRIEGVLNEPLREPFDFMAQPLSDVVTMLEEVYDIPIEFDKAALDAVAASPDIEVTLQIHNVSLRSALDLMLKNAGAEELTYIIDHEVLLITTQEEAQSRLELTTYRVDDLIGDGVTGTPYAADSAVLIDLITSSVESESWRVNGTGEGDIKFFPPGMVVITQTHRVQGQVQSLLEDLRRNKAAVEAATAERSAAAGDRPVSRSIPLDLHAGVVEGSAKRIQEALMKSVDWDSAEAELPDDDKLLMVLGNRVLVRHMPQVVAQVEQVMRDYKLSRPENASVQRGGNGGGGMGGAMGGRGGGF